MIVISKPVLLMFAQQEHIEALADTGLCCALVLLHVVQLDTALSSSTKGDPKWFHHWMSCCGASSGCWDALVMYVTEEKEMLDGFAPAGAV